MQRPLERIQPTGESRASWKSFQAAASPLAAAHGLRLQYSSGNQSGTARQHPLHVAWVTTPIFTYCGSGNGCRSYGVTST